MDHVYQSNVSQTAPKLLGYQSGYPKSATPSGSATIPGAFWYYSITEEVRNAILAGGIVPDAQANNQLAQAIQSLAGSTAVQVVAPFAASIATAQTNASAAVVAAESAQTAAALAGSTSVNLQTVSGAGLVGYGPKQAYSPGSIGRHLACSISITDAPYLCIGSGDETGKIQQAITDLLPGQELLIPDGTFSHGGLTFSGKTDFALRLQGALVNIAAKPGGTNADMRSSASGLLTVRFDNCARFKISGAGNFQNGFREALYFNVCSDFDVSVDCRGNATNDNLPGLYIRYCTRFHFGRMTIDGVTAKPTNNSTEVLVNHLNNVQIWDCINFTFDKVTSRNAGMNGIYPGSNCSDFSILNCRLEYNAGSGCQPAWSSFGIFPVRWNFSNNLCRYNQADGLDVNNTMGSNIDIYAVIHGNNYLYNGWINGNPANAAGSDGSGIGTFYGVDRWSATNNHALEPASHGLYVSQCNNWSVIGGTISKQNPGTLNTGVYLTGGTSGRLSGLDVRVLPTMTALATQSMNDTVIRANSFDGLLSFANGSYVGCKFSENRCVAYNQVLVQFDFMDNDVIVGNPGQNGLYISAPSLKVQRNRVTATAMGIVNTNMNYTDLSGNTVAVSGSGEGMYVTGSTGVNVYGNDAVAVSAAGIRITGSSNKTILANNRGSSSTGNSILVDASCTNTQKFGNIGVLGADTYGGTYGLNF